MIRRAIRAASAFAGGLRAPASPNARRCSMLPLAAICAFTPVLLVGCADGSLTDVEANEPAVVAAESPTLQYVARTREAPARIVVRVADSTGRPLTRHRVQFSATVGALEIATGSVRTDSAGRARLPQWLVREQRAYQVDVRVNSGAPLSFRVLSLPAEILGGPTAQACPLLDQRLPHFPNLSSTISRLSRGDPLTIVALGSSSTFGTGLDARELAYPAQLQAMLQRVFPRSAITVVNAGVPGNTAADLDARLDADVLATNPQLVVLQTGTNDALRRVPLDSLRAITARTILRFQARGIDVVLLDPQRFAGAGETDEFRMYVDAVTATAEANGVGTAHRYGWMTAVINARRYTMGELLTADGLHQSALSHLCTAHLLTTGIGVAMIESGSR